MLNDEDDPLQTHLQEIGLIAERVGSPRQREIFEALKRFGDEELVCEDLEITLLNFRTQRNRLFEKIRKYSDPEAV